MAHARRRLRPPQLSSDRQRGQREEIIVVLNIGDRPAEQETGPVRILLSTRAEQADGTVLANIRLRPNEGVIACRVRA